MTDILLELNLEISAYVYELHELQGVIKDLASDPNHDSVYMDEVSKRYMSLCDKLRIILESYFAEERAIGAPAEFSYRKLYRQLIS